MAFESPISSNVDRFSVAASLLDCLAYAVRIDKRGKPTTIWHAGSVRDLTTPPATLHFTAGGGAAKIAAPDTETFEAHWKKLMSGIKSVEEYRMVLANGSTRWVREAATPVHDRQGALVEIIGSVQDITDVRSAATAVLDEGLILDAFRQSEFGMAFWDQTDCLLVYNPKFVEYFHAISAYLEPGLSHKKFLELASSIGEIFSGSDRQSWIDERQRLHLQGGSSEIMLPDGRCLQFKEDVIAASGSVTMITDLSAQRRGEQALRQAKEVAEAANATKSRFLRAANHDLRQPLATLKILIYSCMTEDDKEHLKDLLHAMDISASIMEDILGALLQVGQLDAGKITPRKTNFQVAPFLERIRLQFQHQAVEKGLQLRVLSNQATIVSDRALLERVISNFVANAIRHTVSGKILVGCRKLESGLRMQVHDTGCGISKDHLDAIFEEFYQVPGEHTKRKQGLGLGLSIAQRIAQILGHPIRVTSQLGKGSTFSLDLPLGDIWKSHVGEPEVSEAIGGQFAGTKALVIEDDEILRDTLSKLLERWGVDIRQAAGAEDLSAIIEAGNWTPDLLLADYRLRHGARGTEIARTVRERVAGDLPCIVMTADTDPALISQIRSENFPLLIKPVNPPQLRVMMHNLLFEPDLLEKEGL